MGSGAFLGLPDDLNAVVSLNRSTILFVQFSSPNGFPLLTEFLIVAIDVTSSFSFTQFKYDDVMLVGHGAKSFFCSAVPFYLLHKLDHFQSSACAVSFARTGFRST
jgi:hypothetical protein